MLPRDAEPTADPVQLRAAELLLAPWVTQAIGAAARLGIGDHLAAGPKPAAELAKLAGAHAPSLHRLLRGLAAVGVLEERAGHLFALTPLGTRLLGGGPDSLRPLSLFLTEELGWRALPELGPAVRAGEARMPKVLKDNAAAFRARAAELGPLFNDAMTAMSRLESGPVVEAYDFRGVGTLVDVGGGHGNLLAAVLRRNPGMRGVLFDLPKVVAGAPPLLAREGVADRVQVVGGDFLKEVPRGGDAYMLARVLHNVDDGLAHAILASVRRSMEPGKRLLIVDPVLPDGPEPTLSKIQDLRLIVQGGAYRTVEGHRRLVEGAGFRFARVVPTRWSVSVVEATAA